jgi:putative transcriptional regulator
MMTLGYTGWGAGQLEEEIALNGWMNVPLSCLEISKIIFDTPYAERYQRAIQNLGFDLLSLSGEAGHA